ncbi:MAG: RNA polymerase sigma factor [Candidatus Brocadiia bacterium]
MAAERELAQVVAAARAGSQEAWRRLVAAHEAGLVRIAWALTGDRQRAVELAHEAFVEAFLRIRQLRRDEAFGAWVRTILVRTARRSWRREPPRHAEPEHRRTPQDEAMGQELRRAVDRAIAALRPIHREALALAMDGEVTSAQAAELLGCSPEAFRVRLHGARAELRKRLGDFLQEP